MGERGPGSGPGFDLVQSRPDVRTCTDQAGDVQGVRGAGEDCLSEQSERVPQPATNTLRSAGESKAFVSFWLRIVCCIGQGL